MSKRTYIGGAAAVAQVETFTPANVEVNDVFTITITLESGATVAVSFTATATTVANVTAGLTAAWNNNTVAKQLASASDGTTLLTLTAANSGVPFTTAASTTDGGGTNTQTLTKATITASAGPYDLNIAGNYAEGIVPVAGDDVTFASGKALYGLNQSAVFTGKITFLPSFVNAQCGSAGNRLQCAPTGLVIDAGGTTAIWLDIGSANIPVTVNTTGSPTSSAYGVDLIGSNMTTVTANSGSVGIAVNAGETATIATFVNNGATVVVGSGVTLTTFVQATGTATVNCAATTISVNGGTLTTRGTGAMTTATVSGNGTLVSNSSGTITNLKRLGGSADFTKSRASRTVTNDTYTIGGEIIFDPTVVTFTNGHQPLSGSGAISMVAKSV